MADPEQCLQVESPEVAACEGDSADLGAVEGSSSMAAEDEAASQALERLESAGEAACCLNDTFEVGPRTQMHPAPRRLKASLLLTSLPRLPRCCTCRSVHVRRGGAWNTHAGHARQMLAGSGLAGGTWQVVPGWWCSIMMSHVPAQEEQLEAVALQGELEQNEADLAAIHKILSSPFVQRDAMRTSGQTPSWSSHRPFCLTHCLCQTIPCGCAAC